MGASTSAWLQAPRNLADWLQSEDKLNNVNEYEMMRLYGLSKASNIVYSRMYTQRYAASNNIFAISLHPGLIATNISAQHWFTHNIAVNVVKLFGITKSVSQGAATSVRLASMSDDEFVQNAGKFYEDCNQIDLNNLQHLYRKDLLEDGEESDRLGQMLWDLSI